ncbi:extracellular solute-binding protein [Vibrio hannami]|uniref:extracellular solute-binding protein n=1 Tax=Vibrio hannami TaxID=2717094 RepID=UPI00240FCEF6|nr:extracellular solute-binding protein [Vibrio hannami]MDG3087860.1 extracellular solute-binding protein [Vibrio hannami]
MAFTPCSVKSQSINVNNFVQEQLQTVPSQFQLSDIPEIANKKPLRVVVEKGLGSSLLLPYVVPNFERFTGIKVEIVEMTLEQMGAYQLNSLQNLESKYDLVTVEGSWVSSWADQGLLLPMATLARTFDTPNNLADHISYIYPSLVELLTYRSELYALPYTNYTMVSHYRRDLFNHPDEQASFEAQYGYILAPPANKKQLIDVAKFFTRSKGEKLAGEVLTEDFFGVSLMAGYEPHIGDEFSSLLWGFDGSWLSPIYDADSGNINGFQVNNQNDAFIQTSDTYLKLLEYAPPQAINSSWNEASIQFSTGKTALFPFAYNNLWSLNAKVEELIPNAEIAASHVPLGKPYFGAYGMSVPIDAPNPEGAYWLLRYITSFEGQLASAVYSGSPCRSDVVTLPVFQKQKMHRISGSFSQVHKAMMSWRGELQNKGHYTSIAMQHIYNELKEASYAVASRRLKPEFALIQLNKKIGTLQNLYGRHPMILSPLEAYPNEN